MAFSSHFKWQPHRNEVFSQLTLFFHPSYHFSFFTPDPATVRNVTVLSTQSTSVEVGFAKTFEDGIVDSYVAVIKRTGFEEVLEVCMIVFEDRCLKEQKIEHCTTGLF